MATVEWNADESATYDRSHAAMFAPDVVGPTVERLGALAAGGPALEFAIGTGRIALALRAAGVPVAGIELSPAMVEQLQAKPEGPTIDVVIGDMATARIDGEFTLVYLVFNTIMNVTTQDEQVAVFRNAAHHLRPGGRFVIEVVVPQPRVRATGEATLVFTMDDDHVGISVIDDDVGQISSSHHWLDIDGRMVHRSAPYRYVYPSELDLMAQLAGLRLEHRWSDWSGGEFVGTSPSHVSVWRRPV